MDVLEYIKKMQEMYGDDVITTADKLEKPPKTVIREMFEDANERFNQADGGRIGFMSGKSANQYGPFTTKSKIGTPATGETISKSEFNKIKKLLKDRPGIGIYPTQREGAYTIKVKVEKGGKIIQEDLLYSKDNLDTMLKKWQSARDQLFPNQITDAKFKELRLLNDTLTDAQFADLLNESNYLTSKGDPFNATSAFNWKKRLDLGSLGPRTFRTIEEAEKVVKEKFGKDFKKIFKNDSEIFAKATQLINDKGKFKGSFPRGAGAEDFLWHSFNRAAKGGSKQITYDLSALGYELPVENGKINWNKKIDGTPAWKLVKFKDNEVGKTFSYNEKNGKHIIGDLKNQVNTAYNNTNKFNNAVKGFYEQAEIGQKFSGRLRDDFLIKELEAKMGRKITKADSELVDNWLASRRPGFSLTQVHHPEGVVKNVYNTQNVFTAANLRERDLIKTFNKEVKTIGKTAAQKNYNKGLEAISDEFGGIQKKIGSKYVGIAPTKESLINILEKYIKSGDNAATIASKIKKAPIPNKFKSLLLSIIATGGAVTGADFLKKSGILFDKEFEPTASADVPPLVAEGLSTGEKAAIGTGTAAAYKFRKPLMKAAGKTLSALTGPLPIAGMYAIPGFGMDPKSSIDRSILGAELAFAPSMIKQAQKFRRSISNPLLRKIATVGTMGIPKYAIRAARIASPIGIASLAGEGLYHLGKKGYNQYQLMKGMTEQEKSDYLVDQYEDLGGVYGEGAADGGLIGDKSGPAPTGGPMSQGLRSLYNNGKKL